MTRERIRQIEAKTLAKLRHPQRSQRLREFLESRVTARVVGGPSPPARSPPIEPLFPGVQPITSAFVNPG